MVGCQDQRDLLCISTGLHEFLSTDVPAFAASHAVILCIKVSRLNPLLKSSNPLKGARRSTGCSTMNWFTCPPTPLSSYFSKSVCQFLHTFDPNISLHRLPMAISLFSLFLWKKLAHLLRAKSNQWPTLSHVRSPWVQCEGLVYLLWSIWERSHQWLASGRGTI